MTYIPYLGTFFFSRYPSVALARNQTGDEPQTQDTQANMRTPPLRRVVSSCFKGGVLMFVLSVIYINQTGDEPQKQDTQANKRSPLLSEEVPYQITLIGLSQGSLDIGGGGRKSSRRCSRRMTATRYNLQALLAKNKKSFWPAFVTRLLTPGHENPAMGFFRGVDQD